MLRPHEPIRLFWLRLRWMGLLLFVGLLGFLALARLRNETQKIVSDTLPGLSYAGKAKSSLADSLACTLMLVASDQPEERGLLRTQIESSCATAAF
jgi:hypothetical protein